MSLAWLAPCLSFPWVFAPVDFASTLVSFRLLIARHLLLGRYLILLDRFLADFTPQEIEAMTMPTLEEVRATLDARGSQLVQQALASVPGKSGLVMCIHAPCRNLHEFSTIGMHRQCFRVLSIPVHLQAQVMIRALMVTLFLMPRAPRSAQAWTRPLLYVLSFWP